MSYQFSIDQTNRSLKFPVIVMAGIVSTVIAAYAFAACGDRTPDQAAAGERVIPPTTNVPVTNVSSETSTARVYSGPVTFEMADSAYRDRRYDDAATLFKSYSEGRPTNPWGFYMLGLSAWKSGDPLTAESAFVQALTLDPTHVKSHLNLSRVLLETERPDSALVEIEKAIQLDSTSSEPERLQGRAFEALGRTDDAILAYQRAVQLDSSDVWALNNLGALYIRLERFPEAIEPLQLAVALNDKTAVFHNNLGMALERTGQYRAAEEEYRAAVAIEGTYGKAVTNLQRVQQLKEVPAPQQ